MRFVKMRLVVPSHRMPMPAPHARLFGEAGEVVDMDDPFWHALKQDGSIEPAPEDEADAPPPPAADHGDDAQPVIPAAISDLVASLHE